MLIESIKKRRSIRAYKSDPIADEKVKEIIRAGKVAPSAFGSGALEFIVIKDQKMKESIFKVVGQEFYKEAPVVIVPVATHEAKLPVQDIAVASENMLLQATELELGSVWKNVAPEFEEQIKELLGVPVNFKVINLIPLGLSDEEQSEHAEDLSVTEKIHLEKW
ncbi:MAG: nitroreductase family protein [Patescibacteria group bacterium]|jgi:nitroreductase|nr:nitroreductase family protein [Patescibacteria group bacterium]